MFRNKYLSNLTDIIYSWYICAHAQVHKTKWSLVLLAIFSFGINTKKSVPIIYFVKRVKRYKIVAT